jgi:hypothetical protein
LKVFVAINNHFSQNKKTAFVMPSEAKNLKALLWATLAQIDERAHEAVLPTLNTEK